MDIIRYVNTESPAGGSGKTRGTEGQDRAYGSLAEWDAGECETSIHDHYVYCSGATKDTQGVDLGGWDVNSISILGDPIKSSGRHPGKWDDSCYRLSCLDDTVLEILICNILIEGIQIDCDLYWTNKDARGIVISGDLDEGDIVINACIVRRSVGSGGIGIQDTLSMGGGHAVYIRNSIVMGFNDNIEIQRVVSDSSPINCFNNTIKDADRYGIKLAKRGEEIAIANIKNNVIINSGDKDYYDDGADFTVNTAANVTSDRSSPDGASHQGRVPSFVDEVNDDLHLNPNDTVARSQGVGLSNFFNDDIDLESRGSAWDCGADQVKIKRPI